MTGHHYERGRGPPTSPIGQCPPLQLSIPAEPARLPGVRHALAEWAATSGLTDSDVEALVLAANEAVANAIEHAYPPGAAGEVWVTATFDGDRRVVVTVADGGCWRPLPSDPGMRGRGLTLIERLSATARLLRSDKGTTVEMRWLLPR
ncbi:MAG: ATP-binding protein [Pseudonocardiaceae bacterium]